LPTAKSLAGWLGISWQEVKTVALDESRDRVRTYGRRHSAAPRPWRDADGAALAMRRVAEALGRDELSTTGYDAFREKAPVATRNLLPTSFQIIKLFGDWYRALAQAGLRPAVGGRVSTGMPVIEAIGLFVRTQGRLPDRRELEAFAKDPRWAFPLQRLNGTAWDQWLAQFERWWAQELGHEMPSRSERRPFSPLDENDIAALPRQRRAPRGWWTRERVIECVVAYLEAHPEVRSLQQRPYREWATERSAGGVWTAQASTLTSHGALEELEHEARRQMNPRPAEG
jgi:hypothetical protein